MPERRARGDAVEVGVYDFGPAAEREGVNAELLAQSADGGVEGGGLFEVFFGGFRAGGVGFHYFKRLVELRLRNFPRVVHDLEHHDVVELGPELRAQHHFVAAGSVKARDAPADQPYAHIGNRVHCADDAYRLVEPLLRLFVADVSVDVEIRNVEAVHEVRIHVGRAERVCLEPSAGRVGLDYRPEDDGNFEAFGKQRYDGTERKRRKERDYHVGAVFLELFENFESLGLGFNHVLAADDFHAVDFAQHFERVAALFLHCFVSPVDLRERKETYLDFFAHSLLLFIFVFIKLPFG